MAATCRTLGDPWKQYGRLTNGHKLRNRVRGYEPLRRISVMPITIQWVPWAWFHTLYPRKTMAGPEPFGVPRQRSSPTRVVRCRRNGTRGAGLKGYNERSQNKSQIYGHYTCPCIPACPRPFSRPPLSSLHFPSPFLNVQFPTTKIKYLIRFLVASRVSLSSKYTCTHLREIEHDRTIGS